MNYILLNMGDYFRPIKIIEGKHTMIKRNDHLFWDTWYWVSEDGEEWTPAKWVDKLNGRWMVGGWEIDMEVKYWIRIPQPEVLEIADL